ncbi:MAG: cytochrome C [bacterium]|nr:cytochrome C [bacterium]
MSQAFMRKRHYLHYFFISFFILGGMLITAENTPKADTHEIDMEKQTCIQCHREATPDVVKQWRESAHRYVGIKCGVCHGDKANYKKVPGNSVCIGCHSKAVEGKKLKGKTCSTCHPTHHFTMHRVKDYQKKPASAAEKGDKK